MASSSYITNMINNLKADAEIVSQLHTEQQFVQPFDETRQNTTKTVLRTFTIICITHVVIIKYLANNMQKVKALKGVVEKVSSSNGTINGTSNGSTENGSTVISSSSSSSPEDDRKEIMKLSYQATNLLVNLFLGITGLLTILGTCYVSSNDTNEEGCSLLNPIYEPDILKRISGYNQYTHFSAYQLAYNIWAIPIGIFYTNENKFMLLHHMSVVTSTTLACYTNIGYKLNSVYIFGFAEISSVPLAIMNFLRDHSDWTKQHCALFLVIIKVVFSVCFLLLRVVIATPMIMDLLRSSFLVLWTCYMTSGGGGGGNFVIVIGKIILFAFNFLLMCALGFLQYYWAYLIVSGLARMAIPEKKKKVE